MAARRFDSSNNHVHIFTGEVFLNTVIFSSLHDFKRKHILTLSNKHQVILRYILLLNTVVLIVFMLPREAQFNYSYKIGKPWVYENIIAPFDFAINKSEEEIVKERQVRIK